MLSTTRNPNMTFILTSEHVFNTALAFEVAIVIRHFTPSVGHRHIYKFSKFIIAKIFVFFWGGGKSSKMMNIYRHFTNVSSNDTLVNDVHNGLLLDTYLIDMPLPVAPLPRLICQFSCIFR